MQTDDWLNQLPPPDPDGAERVRARLQASRQAPRRRWPLALAATGAVAAVAAAALLTLRETPRTEALDAVQSVHVAWSADVQLDYQGVGVAEGTPADLVVQWQEGIVRAEVAPNQGNRVQVRTTEAVVTVVGTVFAVERSPLGTTTWVDRGQVHVRCADGTEHDVTPDADAVTCLPVRPGALLGRADALIARDAELDIVLDTLARGLDAAVPGSSTEGELLARRLEQEARGGDAASAQGTATAYVAGGHTLRLDTVARTAARLATQDARCDEAAAWLARLDAPPLDDRLGLARCWTDRGDLERAEALLRSARGAGEPLPESWLRWLDAVEAP